MNGNQGNNNGSILREGSDSAGNGASGGDNRDSGSGSNEALTPAQRLVIAVGVARGLHYLHKVHHAILPT